MGDEIVCCMKLLQDKYLVVEGLMLNPENEHIVKSLVNDINFIFDDLMTKCIDLSDEDTLPKTSTTKHKLALAKSEFDMRVKDWLESERVSSAKGSKRSTPSETCKKDVDTLSRKSSCSSRSSMKSGMSSRHKKGFVKYKMAVFAKDLEAEKSLVAAHDSKCREEIEQRQREVLREALRLKEAAQRQAEDARRQAEDAKRQAEDARRHAEDIMCEAKYRIENVNQEAERMKKSLDREAAQHQRKWDAQMAAAEVEAWEEVSNYGAEEAASIPRIIAPSLLGRGSSIFNDDRFKSESAVLKARKLNVNIPKVIPLTSNEETKPALVSSVNQYAAASGNTYSARNAGDSSSNPKIMWQQPTASATTAVDVPTLQPTSWRTSMNTGRGGYQPPLSQDYPPPRPEISKFNGDPLSYWTFIRSFDTHIASKMPNDEARLVYLLQHCSPKIRQDLEHFARDGNTGYQLARESLFSAYGQPHIVAFCCEERLLSSPRLKEKEPSALKSMAIQMEKCLAMLRDIGEFATLNSFGTIQKLTDKFPEEMKRDWVKWSFNVLKKSGKQAKFEELVEFVRHESEEANSLYGRALYTTAKSSSLRPSLKKTSVFGTVASSNVKMKTIVSKKQCLFCQRNHRLEKCEDFQRLGRYRRVEFLRKNKLCFRCLSQGHMLSECESKQDCTVLGCQDKRHHTLLHKHSSDSANEASSSSSEPERVLCSSVDKGGIDRRPYFMTIPIRVTCGKNTICTYALLDTGSQRTFCDQRLAERLEATGPKITLPIQTLSSGITSKNVSGSLVSLMIQSLDRSTEVKLHNVFTVSNIPMKAVAIPNQSALEKMNHLKGVELMELGDKSAGLLIGLDAPELFRPLEYRYGDKGEPDAIKTLMGWTMFGVADSASHDDSTFCFNVGVLRPDKLDSPPHEFVESCGLNEENSREDRISHQLLQDSIQHVGGHFQLPLLWKSRNILLPNNFLMAQKRLESLKRRLSNDLSLHEKYTEVMQSYIDQGYAELVNNSECSHEFGYSNSWYLPHHPVVNARKPEKLRIVYDCAAKFMGTSLNGVLMQGPYLTNSLVGVLTRFRLEKVALASDIRAMFHQVKVDPRDRNALKFLWWPKGNLNKPPSTYRMTVHLFGATSSPSCATFALQEAAKRFGKQDMSKAKEVILRNFYVDDCLFSTSTVEEGVSLIRSISHILEKAGFHLTKWMSNNEEILSAVPEKDRAKSFVAASLGSIASERVLGVEWNASSDEFQIKVNIPQKPATRRGILSMTHSLFDPLGFVAPVLVEPKLLLRELSSRDWDEVIADVERERWKAWLSSLVHLEGLALPRCYSPVGCSENYCELHHFADASKTAYGAVSYLRIIDSRKNIYCSFIMGKSHLAPVPCTTIPRLELLAAVTAVRLDRIIRRELPMLKSVKSYFWSDSTAVLHMIYNSKKRFPVFIANRLAEVERLSRIENWRYVPTKENPADEVSRGVPADIFVKQSHWLRGPSFLWSTTDEWPEQLDKLSGLASDLVLLEERVETEKIMTAVVVKDLPTNRLINYFSSLYRLKRAVAWWLRFIAFLYTKQTLKQNEIHLSKDLSVEDLKIAEKRLVLYVQSINFASLITALRHDKPLTDVFCSRPLQKLTPFLHEGIIRVGGRLSKAPIEFETRHPAILPGDCYFTTLVVRHFHNSVGHSGVSHTYHSIRQRYWIERASSTIRNVINNCVFCLRRTAPLGEQMMADLPASRLSMETPAFFHTGVDYFGAINVKQGRSVVKRYGCLFCCMTIRAVHLEMAYSMSTDSFISALRKFISRRGNVAHLYSDNGSNFIGAEKVLRESIQQWNQGQIVQYLHQNEINWHFNPPKASHCGGAWERLVKSVKKVLTSLAPKTTVFTDESLTTLFTEVEAIVNSRPLFPVSFVEDCERPLAPADLLTMKADMRLPPMESTQIDAQRSNKWQQVQFYADVFWKRWRREFLPTIASRQKWIRPRRNVAVNDIVLLVEDSTPRLQWPLGRVIETYPDDKGFVRTVLVKTKSTELKRTVNKLSVLIPCEENEDNLVKKPTWLCK